MSKPKPSYWPENPYPEKIFTMARDKYSKIVPDKPTRTALSEMLGREFWEIASDTIWEAVEAELAQYRWIPVSEGLPEEQAYFLVIRQDHGHEPEVSFYNNETYGGRYSTGFSRGMPVTHWKPITLPKGE